MKIKKYQYTKDLLSFLIILSLVLFTRLIPHPPNFTMIISLIFYISIFCKVKTRSYIIISFIISDFILGIHETILFTWSSLILISFIANKFSKTVLKRIAGIFLSVFIFYILSNLGVWLYESHGNKLNLIEVYLLGTLFLKNNIISSIILSIFIEICLILSKFIKKRNIYADK